MSAKKDKLIIGIPKKRKYNGLPFESIPLPMDKCQQTSTNKEKHNEVDQ